MSSKSRSSSKLLNKRLEDIWSHWSPRHSGKTTQSLLLIMETEAASLGLKITLKISLLLRHYFLGLLPFAAPTWNCYRTITVCSSTSGSNKKTFAVEKKVKCENRLKKKLCLLQPTRADNISEEANVPSGRGRREAAAPQHHCEAAMCWKTEEV